MADDQIQEQAEKVRKRLKQISRCQISNKKKSQG